MSIGAGWTIIAACSPSNTPSRSMRTLPPPFSSAGVPNTLTVMPRSSATGASSRPAGHALRGHNIIAAAAVTAGRLLAPVADDLGITARPAPAEENGGRTP